MRPILYVEPALCQACTSCSARLACKPRAIMQIERGELPAVDSSRCLGCKACMLACPHGAVRTVHLRHSDNGHETS